MSKKAIFILVVSILIFLVAGFRKYSELVVIPWEHYGENQYRFIAHAGGGIDGFTYTDSVQALRLSKSKGFKIFEFDLNVSKDGELVALHDWASFREFSSIEPAMGHAPLTSADVKKATLHGKFTSVTIKEINDIIGNDKELYLVTDKSNDFVKLSNAFNFHDRVFTEVFGVKNYVKAILNNVRRPMYAIGALKKGEVFEIIRLYLLNVKYVTADYLVYKDHAKLFEWLNGRGVKVFLYTINDCKIMEEILHKQDVTFYTDYISPPVSNSQNNKVDLCSDR